MAKGFDRNFVLMASSRVRVGAGQVARMHVDVGMSKDLRGRRFSRIVVVVLVVVEQLLGVVEGVYSGLAVVE
ncbi:hypothetical protein, partial [Mycobacterium canetti]